MCENEKMLEIGDVAKRESSIIQLILGQMRLSEAIHSGSTVQIRASGDSRQSSLFPFAATIVVNSGDANSALRSVGELPDGLGCVFICNAMQFLVETRTFLADCFAKLAVGGVLIITAPHQFLYERKLRLPSRRESRHRRFFTPNTLLAEIEEAIDPCAYRIRYLADSDEGYDYYAKITDEPAGGQDIVVAIEKIPTPHWQGALDRDELWADTPTQHVRFLEVDRNAPALIRTFVPDRHGVHRIVVLKLDHRGDFLMATEAFATLRKSFREAEITLVCGSWNVAEAEKLGQFDKVIAFDFFSEDDSARQETPPLDLLIKRFAEQMRGEVYDLAIDLRLYDDTREVLRAVTARNRAGFDRYDSFPWLTIRLSLPSPTDDDRAEVGFLAAGLFSSSVCRHHGFEIRCDEPIRLEWQPIIWGPYNELTAGHYRFECLIEAQGEEFDAPFDIVTNLGTETLMAGSMRISRDRRPEFFLEIDRPCESFEFRIIAQSQYELRPFRFFGLRFVRSNVMRGQHQSEAMALLAYLIELRLRDAYATESL